MINDIVLLLGAITAMAVAIITAWRTGAKVDAVHVLTNRNFTEQKNEITQLKAELVKALKTIAVKEATGEYKTDHKGE